MTVTQFFTLLGECIVETVKIGIQVVTGVGGVIWDSTANQGAGEATITGMLLLSGLAFSLFWVSFRLIRKLVRLQG